MKLLNDEIKELLDRLYNLRGSDSVILKQMEDEKISFEEIRDKSSSLKTELEETVRKSNEELQLLQTEGDRLKQALASFNKNEFGFVLSKLNLDFNPDALREKLDRTLPLTIDRINSEKKMANDRLQSVTDDINNALMKLSELDIRKTEMLSCQERLNKYFEMALSSNINITRDEITDLLSRFGFNDYEKREAAKLLMFPEDGLFEYESLLKNGYTFESSDEPQVNVSDLIANEVTSDAVEIQNVDINVEKVDADEHRDNLDKREEENNFSETITKDNLIEFLTANGFDYLDFTANDFEKMITNFDRNLYEKNIHIIEQIGISNDIFADNIELFFDKELSKKVEKLIGLGKDPKDIYLNSNILIKYKYDELNEAISLLASNGLDPKNVPLMAF